MRAAILLTWAKGDRSKTPELKYFAVPREANSAFSKIIGSDTAAEIWEPGMGRVRRYGGGKGRINMEGGIQFHDGLKRAIERNKQQQAEAEEARKKAQHARAEKLKQQDAIVEEVLGGKTKPTPAAAPAGKTAAKGKGGSGKTKLTPAAAKPEPATDAGAPGEAEELTGEELQETE
jgi:hypothetical protein